MSSKIFKFRDSYDTHKSILTNCNQRSLKYYFNAMLFFIPVFSNILLISTGKIDREWVNNTEVLNFDSNNIQLPTYQNHPKSIEGATGGFIKNQFVICGGASNLVGILKECYKIGTTNISLHGTMKEKWFYAASIVLADNRLWILGGAQWVEILHRGPS